MRPPKKERLRRTRSLTVLLNEREYKAIQDHCRERKVACRSEWVRLTLMKEIFHEHMLHAPTLFNEEEMR